MLLFLESIMLHLPLQLNFVACDVWVSDATLTKRCTPSTFLHSNTPEKDKIDEFASMSLRNS